MSNEQSNNTIDGVLFPDLLHILLAHDYRSPCPLYIAKKLHTADPHEEFIHVEYGTEHAVVWSIRDWRSSLLRHKREKELSALERKDSYLRDEVCAAVARHLKRAFQFDDTMAQRVASAAVSSRNPDAIRKLTGVNIAELMKADAELATFKKENKIRV